MDVFGYLKNCVFIWMEWVDGVVMMVCCKFDGRLGFGVSVEIRVLLVNMMLVDVNCRERVEVFFLSNLVVSCGV